MDEMKAEMERLFAAKEARRRELAAMPYHEKLKAILKMQRMVAPIYRARGIDVKPWDIELEP